MDHIRSASVRDGVTIPGWRPFLIAVSRRVTRSKARLGYHVLLLEPVKFPG